MTEKVEVREAKPLRIEVAIGGPKGLGGESAYQAAVDEGFVGTEADWLASLRGPTGPPGPASDGAYSRIPQEAPSTHWVLHHTLGFYPNVTILDSSGNQVEGTITYPDVGTVVVDFDSPFGGYANLS